MLFNFQSPITPEQSRALLSWSITSGAELFSVNFLYVKGEESEALCRRFFDRLSPFAAGSKVLENIESNGFEVQRCWHLTNKSADQILKETEGHLFANNILHLPEDWLFYVGDVILLQVVSHEDSATIRVTDEQYRVFEKLGIPHKPGCSEWSGLTDEPIRRAPVRV